MQSKCPESLNLNYVEIENRILSHYIGTRRAFNYCFIQLQKDGTWSILFKDHFWDPYYRIGSFTKWNDALDICNRMSKDNT